MKLEYPDNDASPVSLWLWFVVVTLTLALFSPALPVEAQGAPPKIPAICYGELTVNGNQAPVGTVVEAKVEGVIKGRFVTTDVGWYGGPGLKSKLLVEGDNLVGKSVRFYVSGTHEGTAYSDVFAWEEPFWGSGEVMQINLGVTDVLSVAQPDPPEVPVPNPLPVPTEEEDPYPELSGNGTDEPETALSEEDAEETDELAVDTAVEADVDSLSPGWLIGAGVVVAAVLVSTVAGVLIRKKRGNYKESDDL